MGRKARIFQKAVGTYQEVMRRYPMSPVQLKIETTKVCNLNCVGCRRNFPGSIANREPYDGIPHLTTGILYEWVKQVPTKTVRFTGDGEPLMHPNFDGLLETLHDLHITSTFATNGMRLTPAMARHCKQMGVVRIGVSMNGATRETFESMRRGASWDTVLNNAFDAAREGLSIFINYTMLTRKIVEELPKMVTLAHDMGAHGLLVMKAQTVSRDFFEPAVYPELVEHLEEAKRLAKKYKLIVVGSLDPYPKFFRCYDPFIVPFISLNGDVFPCSYMANQRDKEWYYGEVINFPSDNYIMGNAYETPLKEIWKNEAFQELRKLLRRTERKPGSTSSSNWILAKRKNLGPKRFAYCEVCLARWGEAGL